MPVWLTSDGMHTFAYDYDGKMQTATSLIDPDITVTYQYDPMGNRVGRVETDASGQIVSEKKYILDYTGKVPKILLEMTKVSGNWVVTQKNYYYGSMLVMSTDGQNTNRRYYIHDRLGSVRVVTNRSISVLNNYTYTPYGEDIAGQTTETVVNNVRYAGYQYDNELSQYYVWARMYSPYMARFNGYDPVLGDYQEPLTLHQYLYCLNDPINMYDPDGRFAMMDNVTAMGRYAQMASNAQDIGSSVMDYARMVTSGASFSSIMVSMAIDVGMEVGGGKVFDALSGMGSKVMKRYMGGRHGDMILPKGDGLDSHHMPAKSTYDMDYNDMPAIQMDPSDHRKTSSHAHMMGNREYRDVLENMINNGQMRDAMAIELRDIRRVASEVGDPRKYNQAMREMLDYAYGIGLLDK